MPEFLGPADAFSALIGSTAALVLVATATCLLIIMHLRKIQRHAAISDAQLIARLSPIQHFISRAEPASVAASCGPPCSELKAQLSKLEYMMTRVLDAVDKTPSIQYELSQARAFDNTADRRDGQEQTKPWCQCRVSDKQSRSPFRSGAPGSEVSAKHTKLQKVL